MTIKLSSKAAGGTSYPLLAPDLTYPSAQPTGVNYNITTGIDATSGLTTILSLTGSYVVSYLRLANLTSGDTNTLKLTVDGVIIWDDTFTGITDKFLINGPNVSDVIGETIQCESSLLLEIQTTTDTNIRFDHLARPIL